MTGTAELTEWPQEILRPLVLRHGSPVSVEPLHGMSVARVYRLQFPAHSVVVKASPRPAESLFYERVAPALREAGMGIPVVEARAYADGLHWLALEAVRTAPLQSFGDAPAWRRKILSALSRLHSVTRRRAFDIPASPAGSWTPETTDAALTWFDRDARDDVLSLLSAFEPAHERVEDWCWISGDPSPPNWGVREDGAPVLFDWELFRRGIPATDLAITVPGMPEYETFERTASEYATVWGEQSDTLPWTPAELARDMAVAKAGTVAMLLAAQANGQARVPADYVDEIVQAFPGWLTRLRGALQRR